MGLALTAVGCGGSSDVPLSRASGTTPYLARVSLDDQRDGKPDLVVTFRRAIDGTIERDYDFQGDGNIELVVKEASSKEVGLLLDESRQDQTDTNGDNLPDDAAITATDGQGRPTNLNLDNDGNGQVDEKIQLQYNDRGLPIRRSYDDNLDGQADREVTYDYADTLIPEHLRNRSGRQLVLLLLGTTNNS